VEKVAKNIWATSVIFEKLPIVCAKICPIWLPSDPLTSKSSLSISKELNSIEEKKKIWPNRYKGLVAVWPDWANFRPLSDCYFGQFLKTEESHIFEVYFFNGKGYALYYDEKKVWATFWALFHKLVWSPCLLAKKVTKKYAVQKFLAFDGITKLNVHLCTLRIDAGSSSLTMWRGYLIQV
jgi:hypothetical protein